MQNSFGPYNQTVQNLLNLNLLNENIYKNPIEETIINLIRNIKTADMLLELEKAISTRNFNTTCCLVPSKLELYMPLNTQQTPDYAINTVIRSLFNLKLPPYIFATRVWRWPDLNLSIKLKSTNNCMCRLELVKDELCINPYHYERFDNNVGNFATASSPMQHQLTPAATSLPTNENYTNIVNISINQSDANLLANIENTHNLNSSTVNQFSVNHPSDLNLPPINYIEPQFWCTISYYELNHHVGESFHGSQPYVTVDGFVDPSSAERFCLGVLTNVNRARDSEQCRRLIGRGVRLYYIGGEIFAECLSDQAIFVQSPICNILKGWHPASVCKIPTGCNLKIFNNQEFASLLSQTVPKGYNSVFQLTRMCTIRLSFAKGWGNDYTRQAITSTPCWIEIRLNGPFQWLDRILLQMSGPGLLSS